MTGSLGPLNPRCAVIKTFYCRFVRICRADGYSVDGVKNTSSVAAMNHNNTEREGVQIGVTEHSGARIEALFQQEREGLERYLRPRLRGCPDEAKEVAQEAYTRLLELPAQREVPNWVALLWAIARNLADTRNERRKYYEAAIPLLQAESKDERALDSLWSDQQEQAAVRLAIAALPERQREVIALRLEGRNYEQIAQALEISERTCRRDFAQAMVDIRIRIGLGKRT